MNGWPGEPGADWLVASCPAGEGTELSGYDSGPGEASLLRHSGVINPLIPT